MKNTLIPRALEVLDPLHLVHDWESGMNLWATPGTGFAPDVDVKDEADRVVVKADIPGIKKEDLSISFDGDFLTVKGERKEECEKKGKDYFYSERFNGSFSRTIELPARVRAEGSKAAYRDGVLEVTLVKDEAAKPREVKIPIQ